MAGASNPAAAAAGVPGGAFSGGPGLKGGGQAAVAPGPNFTAARAPQMGGSMPPNVFQQSAGAYNAALQGTAGAGAYQPQMVNARFGYRPTNVAAGSVGTQFGYNPANVGAQRAVGGIQTYMNPYTQSVIDTSMADLERQRQTQMGALGAQATQARAFGGSRQGVAEALTNEGFARQGGQLAAGLRQAGFNTALGAAQQDAAANLQAALANQAAGSRAAEFGQQTGLQAQGMNQQTGLQAALANQAAQAQAQQFGQQTGLQAALANQQAGLQGAQLGLSAANQMSGLAGQGFGFGQQIGQQQMQQGAMMQMLNQQLIDAARAQYAGFTGAPQQSLGLPLAAAGAADMGQRTETQSRQPGLLGTLGTAAYIGSMLPFSDRRLKTNIQPLGERNGAKLYSWDWNDEGKRLADPAQPTVGVIADELMQTHPHLVHRGADGYLRVDYSGLPI